MLWSVTVAMGTRAGVWRGQADCAVTATVQVELMDHLGQFEILRPLPPGLPSAPLSSECSVAVKAGHSVGPCPLPGLFQSFL